MTDKGLILTEQSIIKCTIDNNEFIPIIFNDRKLFQSKEAKFIVKSINNF